MMSKTNYLIAFLLTVTSVLFTACETELDIDADQRIKDNLEKLYQYYPLDIGKSWTYQIDSIYYSDNLGSIEIDTVKGLYRETVSDTFRTEDKKLVYRVLKEKFEGEQWNVTRVYSLMRTTNQLIRTEDNIPLIDLVFPLDLDSTFRPTSLIDANRNYLVRGKGILIYKDWSPSYVDDIKIQSIFGEERKVISIQDVKPDDNIILYQSSKRSYAQGVGMIYKEQTFFTTQKTELADSPWEEKAEIGFKCYQTLVEYK